MLRPTLLRELSALSNQTVWTGRSICVERATELSQCDFPISAFAAILNLKMSSRNDNLTQPVHPDSNLSGASLVAVPKSVELDTRIELASWSFAQKDFELATQHAEQVLEEVPCDPRALSLIAACQILLGNLDAGIVRLNQAIDGASIERYEAAAEEAYEYLRFCDDDTVEIEWSGFNECIQFLSQPEFGSDEEERAWEIALKRARACVALSRGEVSDAISDLKNHLRRFPRDVEARFELARAYFKNEDYRICTELLRQVLDEKPEHVFALSMIARVRALSEDFQEAIEYATEAFELNPQSCRIRLDLVEYLFDSAEYEQALDVMSDAPKCSCGWFRFLHARMQCNLQLEQFDAAMASCQEMLGCEESEVDAEIDLAVGKRIAAAHDVLLTAIVDSLEHAMQKLEQEADRLIGEKWFALETASLYREHEQFDLAARLIECLSYEHPHDVDVTFALSIAESEIGNNESERLLLRQVVGQLKDPAAAPLRLSSSYEREGLFKEALYWAFQAHLAGDSQGRVEYLVARIYCQLESFEVSRQFLNAAIDCNSSFRGRAEADDVFAPLNLCG